MGVGSGKMGNGATGDQMGWEGVWARWGVCIKGEGPINWVRGWGIPPVQQYTHNKGRIKSQVCQVRGNKQTQFQNQTKNGEWGGTTCPVSCPMFALSGSSSCFCLSLVCWGGQETTQCQSGCLNKCLWGGWVWYGLGKIK